MAGKIWALPPIYMVAFCKEIIWPILRKSKENGNTIPDPPPLGVPSFFLENTPVLIAPRWTGLPAALNTSRHLPLLIDHQGTRNWPFSPSVFGAFVLSPWGGRRGLSIPYSDAQLQPTYSVTPDIGTPILRNKNVVHLLKIILDLLVIYIFYFFLFSQYAALVSLGLLRF